MGGAPAPSPIGGGIISGQRSKGWSGAPSTVAAAPAPGVTKAAAPSAAASPRSSRALPPRPPPSPQPRAPAAAAVAAPASAVRRGEGGDNEMVERLLEENDSLYRQLEALHLTVAELRRQVSEGAAPAAAGGADRGGDGQRGAASGVHRQTSGGSVDGEGLRRPPPPSESRRRALP